MTNVLNGFEFCIGWIAGIVFLACCLIVLGSMMQWWLDEGRYAYARGMWVVFRKDVHPERWRRY